MKKELLNLKNKVILSFIIGAILIYVGVSIGYLLINIRKSKSDYSQSISNPKTATDSVYYKHEEDLETESGEDWTLYTRLYDISSQCIIVQIFKINEGMIMYKRAYAVFYCKALKEYAIFGMGFSGRYSQSNMLGISMQIFQILKFKKEKEFDSQKNKTKKYNISEG